MDMTLLFNRAFSRRGRKRGQDKDMHHRKPETNHQRPTKGVCRSGYRNWQVQNMIAMFMLAHVQF